MKLSTYMTLILLTLTGIGCGSQPITHDQRDRSGIFSGYWVGVVDADQKYQSHRGWKFYCPTFRTDITFDIADGEIKGSIGQGKDILPFRTPIDSSGRFVAQMKSDIEYTGGDHVAYRTTNKTRYLLKGDLNSQTNEGEGRLMLAMANWERGCAAEFKVHRIASKSQKVTS